MLRTTTLAVFLRRRRLLSLHQPSVITLRRSAEAEVAEVAVEPLLPDLHPVAALLKRVLVLHVEPRLRTR